MGFWYYVTGFYTLFVVGAVISSRGGSFRGFSVATGVKQRARGFLGFISGGFAVAVAGFSVDT